MEVYAVCNLCSHHYISYNFKDLHKQILVLKSFRNIFCQKRKSFKFLFTYEKLQVTNLFLHSRMCTQMQLLSNIDCSRISIKIIIYEDYLKYLPEY